MRIFLVLSNFPKRNGEAIEVVTDEFVRITVIEGHQLDVQIIIRESRNKLHSVDEEEIMLMNKNENINFLPVIYLGDLWNKINIFRRFHRRLLAYIWTPICCLPLLRNHINKLLFPAKCLSNTLEKLVRKIKSDIIISIWSWEALAATYLINRVPKFVYYGNPDHKPEYARLMHPQLFGIKEQTIFHKLLLKQNLFVNKAREIQHLKMMSLCEVTANNSLVDAKYYEEHGHPRSIYLQNMWPKPKKIPNFVYSQNTPIRLVGSVGNLGATGNTFGLYFIGKELIPLLEKEFGKNGFIIDIYGRGTLSPTIEQYLQHPCIHLHGWVEDLDSAIQNSLAFLVLTNVYGFLVGNTRILLAWSLGACLVTHSSTLCSMPEIVAGKNALVGDTAEDIVAAIRNLVDDENLCRKIGIGGYRTFQQNFRSEIVVPKILNLAGDCLKDKKSELC